MSAGVTPQQLAAAAQAGDRDAFAQLWNLYRSSIQGWIYSRTHNHHLAEDITSETFLRAWKNIDRFTWQAGGFPGWVTTIARNITADYYKSGYYQNIWPADTSDELWYHPDTDRRGDPTAAVAHGDLADALDIALTVLTSRERQVITLRFGDDLPIEAVATALGVERGAVKASQHRATRKLRRHPALIAQDAAA